MLFNRICCKTNVFKDTGLFFFFLTPLPGKVIIGRYVDCLTVSAAAVSANSCHVFNFLWCLLFFDTSIYVEKGDDNNTAFPETLLWQPWLKFAWPVLLVCCGSPKTRQRWHWAYQPLIKKKKRKKDSDVNVLVLMIFGAAKTWMSSWILESTRCVTRDKYIWHKSTQMYSSWMTVQIWAKLSFIQHL